MKSRNGIIKERNRPIMTADIYPNNFNSEKLPESILPLFWYDYVIYKIQNMVILKNNIIKINIKTGQIFNRLNMAGANSI